MMVSKVELVVLGLLSEEPLHGYELLERFRTRSMGFWVELGKASVYQALRRLEREGLLVGRHEEGGRGPDRRVYRVTSAGRSRLRAGLSDRLGYPGPYETEAGLALGFLDLLGSRDVLPAIDARGRAVLDLIDAITSERGRASNDSGGARLISDAMLDRQEALAVAELAWIDGFRTARRRLRKEQSTADTTRRKRRATPSHR